MIFTGFPDLLSYSRQTRTTAGVKARLQTTANEAVTGRYEDITKATNGDVGSAHLLKKALNDIQQNQRLNTLSGTRIELITQALKGARTIVSGLDTNAVIALDSQNGPAITNVASDAEANLRSVISTLGLKHGTRNLLSGDATSVPPFAGADNLLDDIRAIIVAGPTPADIETALDTYFDDPAGGFQTNIYIGGDNPPPAARLGDGSILQIDLKGDDPSIKETLRGLAVLAVSESSAFAPGGTEFAEVFGSGITQLSQGIGNLIAKEADIGIYAETIEKADERDQFENRSLTAAFQAIVGRDQFEATTELQQLQVQLEASYLITSKLSNLTLTNFLR